MNLECEQLHAFCDGELDAAEERRFKAHLVGCGSCQAELHDVLQIALRMQALGPRPGKTRDRDAGSPVRPIPFSWRPHRWAAVACAIGITVGGLVALFARSRGGAPPLVAEERVERPLLSRLSLPEADHFLPFNPLRGSPGAAGAAGVKESDAGRVAELERKNDWGAVAAIHLMNDDRRLAAVALERAGASPGADNDRAVLMLSTRRLEEALNLLDGALEAQPRFAQALWNRGLVLEALDLTYTAAASFQKVADLEEPGWSVEARARKEQLDSRSAPRRASWNDAKKAGEELIQTGAAPTEALINRHPGILRHLFYHALRAAPSRERVQKLLPTAAALDHRFGGAPVLARAVQSASRADFVVRGPLAAIYARVEEDPKSLDESERKAWLDRLRKAGQTDILLGALLLSDTLPARIDELRRIAGSLGDPWLAFLAEHETAMAEVARGAPLDAERRLLAALPACHASGMEYRCGYLEHDLSNLYKNLNRPSEARTHALAGFEHALTAGESGLEVLFLQDLAAAARYHRAYGLSRAYLDEIRLRDPDQCEVQQFVRLQRAQLFIEELRPAEARAELVEVRECGKPVQMATADLYAELGRFGVSDEEVTRALAILAAHRALGKLRPADLALADKIEGRLLIGRDRGAAIPILERAIRAADARPQWDVDARKARNYSYLTLVADAGRAGQWDEMLALVAREMDLPPPARCAVGMAEDLGRVIVAARGSDGGARGRLDDHHAGMPARGMVGPELLAALDGCPIVDVYARPPLQGTADILPARFAWRYRVSPSAVEPAKEKAPRRVVVAGVDPPAALELPRLAPFILPSDDRTTTLLAGPDATPARVLSEIGAATEIEFHVHGLVDLGVSDVSLLVLTPGADGLYALTAKQVRNSHLAASPIVILAACRAAETAPYRHEPWSLPIAFIAAGASAVLAAASPIRDLEAVPFFDAVRAGAGKGTSLAVALRDARVAAIARDEHTSMRDVVLFQ